jgi:hypothetical protein
MRTNLFLAIAIITLSLSAFGQGLHLPDDENQGSSANQDLRSNCLVADCSINVVNPGSNGAPLNGPGFGTTSGNICLNVYAFSPDEQLISCCSCLITPNGLISLSVNNDILNNTLTGVRPNSATVKLIASLAGPGGTGTNCTNSAALVQKNAGNFPLAPFGVAAWGTTIHAGAEAGTFAVTEHIIPRITLSDGDLASITNRCTNAIGNGSGFGICRTCRAGGLNAITK